MGKKMLMIDAKEATIQDDTPEYTHLKEAVILDRIKQLLDEMKEKISDLGWHSVYDEIENNITTIKQMLGIKP